MIMEKKLTKGSDKKIWGVCSGMAEYFGMDVTLMRIIWIVVSLFLGAILGGIIVYVICGLVMPDK
jgi:phage shock protein C